MASNQKTPQQKRPKTTHNCFLACFGFHPKTNTTTTNNNNNSTYKKKANNNKYGVIRKKFFFKLCLPKFKVLTIDSKNYKKKKKKKEEIAIKFDAKTSGAFKASHNMMLEAATKVHQQFMIDHHHNHAPKSSITTQQPMAVVLKDIPHQDNNQSRHRSKSQSNCTTCNNIEENGTPKGGMVKESHMGNKITKDSLIGVLIMVAMLIIMSIWGRLCAILCMCGLLYCIPLIRGGNRTQFGPSNPNDNNDTTTDTKIMSVDFNSELYKKKVVLDGLLQRDHQDAVGIS